MSGVLSRGRATAASQIRDDPMKAWNDLTLGTGTKGAFAKAFGISLVGHLALFCLAAFLTGRMTQTLLPPPPSSIVVELQPSRLISMGSGVLHVAPAGSPSPGPKTPAKPKMRTAAAKPAPAKQEAPKPIAPLSTSIEEAPRPEMVEANTASMGLSFLGGNEAAGDGVGVAAGAGSGAAGGGKGGGGSGTGGASGEGSGEGGGGCSGSGYRAGDLPAYPSSAKRTGREGVVTVRALVGVDGKPASVTVLKTSGYDDFDNAAVTAVKKWRFSPARRGKEPVESFHDVRIRFRLDNER